MSNRLSIDMGDTQTDFLLSDGATGRTHSLKARTVPGDPAATVSAGVAELARGAGITPAEIEAVVTTAPAFRLADDDPKAGLLITRGFEQVLHLARGRTAGQFAGAGRPVRADAPIGLAGTRGVAERVSAQGNVITQIDEASARRSIGELLQQGIEALAVCLLHSYANPEHELRIRAIAQEMKEGLPVILSHEVTQQAGEYERALATLMAARAGPALRRRLDALQAGLVAAQTDAKLEVVYATARRESAASAMASATPRQISGRAGGAAGAASIAAAAGFPDALSLDVGGAAAEISLIRNGYARLSNQTDIGGDVIPAPSLDIRTVGAGLGAVARTLAEGLLRIGPKGATPACKGGASPTVMDAQIVLGRLPAERISVDVDAANDAIAALGRSVGLDRHRAAEGVVDVFDEALAGALRLLAVEKGEDPSRLALVASGGAGPMHGCGVSRAMGAGPVIVPLDADVLAAVGALAARRETQFSAGVHRPVRDLRPNEIADVAASLQSQAKAWIAAEGGDGTIGFRADMRYARSGFKASLAVDGDIVSAADDAVRSLADRLAEAHQRRFGIRLDRPAQVVALHAIATIKADLDVPPAHQGAGADPRAAHIGERQVYFDGGFVATAQFDRARLKTGNRIPGPALILQDNATTVINPGCHAEIDAGLNTVIRAGPGAQTGGHAQ